MFKVTLVAPLADHVPDNVLANARAPHRTGPANGSEDSPLGDARRGGPSVKCVFDPLRHGNGSNVAAFADQVDDGPMSLACLDVLQFERGKLGAAQSAAD